MTIVDQTPAVEAKREQHRIAARAYLELLDLDLPVGNVTLSSLLPDTLTITFYARGGGDPFEALAVWVAFLGIGEYGEQLQGNQMNRIASGEYKGLKIELRATVFATSPTVFRAVTV